MAQVSPAASRAVIALPLLALLLVPPPGACAGAPQAPQSPALAAIRDAGDAAALWQRLGEAGTPLIEALPDEPGNMLVTFLWRDAAVDGAHNIAVSGGFLLDQDKVIDPLVRLAGTDILWRSYVLPADARFSYYFVAPRGRSVAPDAVWTERVDGVTQEFFADPLARRRYTEVTLDGTRHRISWAEGPAAPAEPALVAAQRGGKLLDYTIDSAVLGERRPVSVYVPAAAARGDPPGLLLMFDREGFLSAADVPAMLEQMIAAGRIAPMIAVFVGAIDDAHRGRDLPPNPAFQAFLGQELLPFVRERHPFSTDPARNVVAGSSYGGLAAAATGLAQPALFGNVISLSGSYWWSPGCCDDDGEDEGDTELISADAGWLIGEYAREPRRELRLFLDVGRWEGAGMLLPNRMMRDVLTARGYEFAYGEYSGGHDIIQWRANLPRALEYVTAPRRPLPPATPPRAAPPDAHSPGR